MKEAHREVKDAQQESVQSETPPVLQPLRDAVNDALNVDESDAASDCSNGICRLPAPKGE